MLTWMLMPYRRYFEFSGRSRRQEFWKFMLLNVLVYGVVGGITLAVFVNNAAGDINGAGTTAPPLGVLGFAVVALFWLVTWIPSLAVQVRRFHDQDMSGWMWLISLIPTVGGLIVLFFMFRAGTDGPNRFGQDTRDLYEANVFS